MSKDRKWPAPPDGYPKLLTDLADHLAGHLVVGGMQPDLAWLYAFESVDALRSDFGGELLYIPKGDAFDRPKVYQEIFDKFKDGNVTELAHEYGTSVPHIYRVIKKMKAELEKKLQRPLF